jgi:hypothetical protein
MVQSMRDSEDDPDISRGVDPGVRLLAVIAGGIVVVATALFFMFGDDAGSEVAPPLGGGVVGPPSELTVCEGEMTEACAQDAAERSGLPVAWMPAPQGYRLAWVIAEEGSAGNAAGPLLGEGYWSASFQSVDSQTSIELTGFPGGESAVPLPPDGAETVTNGEDTATIQEMDPQFISLFWTHDGNAYMLTGSGQGVGRDVLVAAWRTVRYVQP